MTTAAAATDRVAITDMSDFARSIYKAKYSFDGQEEWSDTARRVTDNVMGALGYGPDSIEHRKVLNLITERKFMPGGRYLYASGRELHQTQNCVLLQAEDSREGWSDLLWKASMSLMTGAGIGIDYSLVRAEGEPIRKIGGTATGPLALMQMVNECGRGIMQGGSRRSAIWAGLNWKHKDIFKFIDAKDWDEETRAKKEDDFNYPATMDQTNMSVLLDDEFFHCFEHEKGMVGPCDAYAPDGRSWHEWARAVYSRAGENMLRHAEPGFSIDVGPNAGETLRNACTEVTSRDDSDICNLGSLNLARFDSLDEFEDAVPYATLFLMAGTVYSDVPYDGIDETRRKNRRLGLGIMGVHEWLLKRGYRYEPNEELATWLDAYAESTGYARQWATRHDLSAPIATRAIAPTGTIGIVAETTTGIEPIFCVAFKRRYLDGKDRWLYQYVIDPTAERLIQAEGLDPYSIEDAHALSYDFERRIKFQAWVQQYVDHGISSTVNLPYSIVDNAERDSFLATLYEYLPKLRGVTCYPDGSRGGQPLTPADYYEAKQNVGTVFEESEERCVGGACGV